MPYTLQQKGNAPRYGDLTSGRTTWRNDSTGKIGDWNQQAGSSNVNSKIADNERLSVPMRSGRWLKSRRDW